ncbi:MAG TPA: hypothetical protein VH079_02640 [Terriglobales bacterium]|nr:hypothetical protein [Terriglobales bacterium]
MPPHIKDKPITGERVVVGADGGLANVVVYISQGLSASEAAVVPSEAVTITQKGCQYLPHVIVANPGQHIKVLNSDQTMHNVHPQPTKNTEWNKSQPQAAPPAPCWFVKGQRPIGSLSLCLAFFFLILRYCWPAASRLSLPAGESLPSWQTNQRKAPYLRDGFKQPCF